MSSINEKLVQLNVVDRFILLLLGAKNGESIPGPVHLQKEMFLLSNIFEELGDETDYEPYFLGPYSEIVADEAEQLLMSGLIKVKSGSISITKEGSEIYQKIIKNSKEKIQKVEEFKEFLNDLTRDELLAFIYFSYPSVEELEKESIEYRDLLPKRRRLAISMYEKGKLSVQKSAQIAGEGLEDFVQHLER